MAPGNVKDAQQASIAFDTLETLARPSEKKRSSCARAAAARSIEMQCSLATCKSCSGTKAVKVPLVEVVAVSVRMSLEATASTLCHFHDGPVLVLHTFRRKGYSWLPVEHQIEFQDVALAAQWMNIIQNLLDRLPDRPDHLFVVINPYGGAGRADNVWLDVVKPIFERAHIASDAFRTGYQDHAVSLIEQMPWEQLEAYDGIVAIGGDGLFQECLRGLLALRTRGGKWRDKARSIRIAQVPAGSTDAVACTINGCRSSVTAAMHIVVGDRSKLDVLEVRTQEGQCRFACSTASYGFIGDVLERSERMRWMGPVRYEIGGALSLAQLQSYPIRLWYREPAAPHPELKVCHSDCPVCSQPRSHTFDSEQLLSIVEEAVSADDDADSDLSEASPMPQARHMRGANGFGDLPVELHRLASAVASNCADATDSSSSSSASQVRLQRSAVSANDDGASSVGPISRCAAAAVQPQQVAVVDAGPAASAAECPGSRCSTSGGSNEPRRPLHMRSASGFGETAAFLQSSAVRGSISSALIAESATTRGEDSGSSKDSTVAMPFEPWLADLSPPTAETSAADGDASRWRLWSGEVASLMVVVTPTRSDKSKAGIVPHAHLSDGRVHLVIVRKCTRFQFLRFLVSLSRGGVDESLDYVEVREVEAWRLEELGQAMPQSSVWNVDGELMKTRHMSARCHHGLVQVFGRGPERL